MDAPDFAEGKLSLSDNQQAAIAVKCDTGLPSTRKSKPATAPSDATPSRIIMLRNDSIPAASRNPPPNAPQTLSSRVGCGMSTSRMVREPLGSRL